MIDCTFKGSDGTQYDLSLNFLTVRNVDKTDFSAITDNPPRIMNLAKFDMQKLYYDMSILSALAFSIVWHKRAIVDPSADVSENSLRDQETKFLANINGQNFDALRTALWNALEDFLPHLAGDLERIRKNDALGRAEIASRAEQIDEFNKKAIQQTIQQTLEREFAKVEKTIHGEQSGDSLAPSVGAGQTSNP